MKESKSLFIASLLLTIKNNFWRDIRARKSPQRKKPSLDFQTVDNLTAQRAQMLTVLKYENHSYGRLNFILKLI